MKIMLRAALTALSVASIGPAFAGEIEGIQPYTQFQQLPNVIAQAPVYNPTVMTAQNGQKVQNGQAVQTYATQSNRGTWFNQGGSHEGANS
jgi:hypothetical protein